MSGLVGNYVGAALGNSMSDIGSMMMRDQQRQDEKEEERQWREDQAQLNREARMAEKQATNQPAIDDDQMNELVAGNLGMSVPQVAAHRNAVLTGDETQFKLEEYPEGISNETLQAKRREIYALMEQYKTGKDYKPIEEGRSEAYRRGLIGRTIEHPDEAPKIGQAVAASEGKGPYGGNSDVIRNEFTGEAKTTDLGRARIRSLDSDVSLDAAKVEEIGNKIQNGTATRDDSERLTTIIEKANSTLKQLLDSPPSRSNKEARAEWQSQVAEWQSLRERSRVLLDGRLKDQEPSPAKPPVPKGSGSKKDYRGLWN